MMQGYIENLDRLIEKGLYLHRGQIIQEGLRYVFRGYGLAPWDKAIAGRDYIILGIDEHERLRWVVLAVRDYIGKLRDQAEKSDDIFERGFCKGIADALENILEAEG